MAKSKYASLLKEAISEFDTSKSVDVKGPMLDPILGYDGGGALQTKKEMNIPGILERFYFEETAEKLVEHTDNEIDEVPGKDDGNVQKSKKDFEKEITEMLESDDGDADDVDGDSDKDEEEGSESEKVEEAVIEKLIAEMEQEGSETEAGTKAAGTGTVEKQIPDRKDATNEDSIIETLMAEMDDEVAATDDDDDDMDVDKELGEVSELGPLGNPSQTDDDELLGEAFEIFKEQIEQDDDIEDEDVIV